jgi:hypothetical protein
MEVEEYIKKHKLKTMSDRQFAMIAASIKEIFFVTDDKGTTVKVDIKNFDDKMSFIEDLDSKEFTTILEAVTKLDFGVKMPFDFKCANCDHESKEEVNVTVFFIS